MLILKKFAIFVVLYAPLLLLDERCYLLIIKDLYSTVKQFYKPPTVKVIEFEVEWGYAISTLTITHEAFLEENSGNESFQDETSDDFANYDWTIF